MGCVFVSYLFVRYFFIGVKGYVVEKYLVLLFFLWKAVVIVYIGRYRVIRVVKRK